MLGGGGGEGGKGDVRRIPDTCVSNPCTKVNETCQNPKILLNFTTFGGLRRPCGRGQLMLSASDSSTGSIGFGRGSMTSVDSVVAPFLLSGVHDEPTTVWGGW